VPAVDAAVRAGIVRFEETAVIGRNGRVLRASRLELLDPDLPRLSRMHAMARFAIEGLVRERRAAASPAVFLALPDTSSDRPAEESWGRHIRQMLNDVFSRGIHSVRSFRHGRSSFFFALQSGLSELSAGTVDAILVGGIDSLCDAETLTRLDEDGRVLGASHDGGLIPGEGAAFVLIERNENRGMRSDETIATVLATTTRHEVCHFRQELPNRAEALTAVFHELHDQIGVRADLMYTCETGEPFWTEELANAYLRNGPLMPEPFRRTMQADAFGDLGAASGAVLMAIGSHNLARLERPAAPVLLLCGSSDEGHVGACLVQMRPSASARPS